MEELKFVDVVEDKRMGILDEELDVVDKIGSAALDGDCDVVDVIGIEILNDELDVVEVLGIGLLEKEPKEFDIEVGEDEDEAAELDCGLLKECEDLDTDVVEAATDLALELLPLLMRGLLQAGGQVETQVRRNSPHGSYEHWKAL